MRIKRAYLRGLSKWRRRKESVLDEEQQLIYNIVHKMCLNRDNKVEDAPSRGAYYIEDRANQYYAVLSDSAIKITNHDFYIVRHYTDTTMKPLIKRVKHRIEKDLNQKDREIFKNELNLLRKISVSLEK